MMYEASYALAKLSIKLTIWFVLNLTLHNNNLCVSLDINKNYLVFNSKKKINTFINIFKISSNKNI